MSISLDLNLVFSCSKDNNHIVLDLNNSKINELISKVLLNLNIDKPCYEEDVAEQIEVEIHES